MAYADIRLGGTDFAARIRNAYARYQENAAKRALYRETYRELSALSGRELADIGVSRGEIRHIAAEHAGL